MSRNQRPRNHYLTKHPPLSPFSLNMESVSLPPPKLKRIAQSGITSEASTINHHMVPEGFFSSFYQLLKNPVYNEFHDEIRPVTLSPQCLRSSMSIPNPQPIPSSTYNEFLDEIRPATPSPQRVPSTPSIPSPQPIRSTRPAKKIGGPMTSKALDDRIDRLYLEPGRLTKDIGPNQYCKKVA
ncbi:hypothetical protein LguiB_018468 [Lonicera macranthoides]